MFESKYKRDANLLSYLAINFSKDVKFDSEKQFSKEILDFTWQIIQSYGNTIVNIQNKKNIDVLCLTIPEELNNYVIILVILRNICEDFKMYHENEEAIMQKILAEESPVTFTFEPMSKWNWTREEFIAWDGDTVKTIHISNNSTIVKNIMFACNAGKDFYPTHFLKQN